MLKILLAGASLSLTPLAAMAADVPSNNPGMTPAASILAPAWDGFYIGVSAAHSLGNVAFKLQDAVELNGFGAIGPSVGVLAGYNMTFSDRWLAGVEVTGEFSDNAARAKLNSGADFVKAKAVTDWDGSISTRFGYLVSPTTLVYTSVGATAVHGKGSYKISLGGNESSQTAQDYFYGVAFAALGVETQISGNWRARFEYVASLLKANVYRDGYKVEVSPQLGAARLALVYGFGGEATARQESVAPDWTGFYAGGGAGRNHSISQYDLDLNAAHLTVDGLGATGWSGSAFVGYNYQLNANYVVGAEIIGTLSSSESRYLLHPNALLPIPMSSGVVGRNKDWVGGRLRAGYLLSPETMAYGIIGYSQVRSELKAVGVLATGPNPYDEKYNRKAIEFGGGMETWMTQSVSVRVEYAFASLERVNLVKDAPQLGLLKHSQSTGLVAAAYHF